MLLSGIFDHELVDLELPPSQQILDWLREGRLHLDAVVRSHTAVCPRLLLGFHPPYGFSVLLLETEASEGLFACRARDFGPTEVLVQFSLVAAELWPVQLFVDDSTACAAIDHVRETGHAAPTLTWVPSGAFPRKTIRLDGMDVDDRDECEANLHDSVPWEEVREELKAKLLRKS